MYYLSDIFKTKILEIIIHLYLQEIAFLEQFQEDSQILLMAMQVSAGRGLDFGI